MFSGEQRYCLDLFGDPLCSLIPLFADPAWPEIPDFLPAAAPPSHPVCGRMRGNELCAVLPPRLSLPRTYRNSARRDVPHDTCIRLSNGPRQDPPDRTPAAYEPESWDAGSAA